MSSLLFTACLDSDEPEPEPSSDPDPELTTIAKSCLDVHDVRVVPHIPCTKPTGSLGEMTCTYDLFIDRTWVPPDGTQCVSNETLTVTCTPCI